MGIVGASWDATQFNVTQHPPNQDLAQRAQLQRSSKGLALVCRMEPCSLEKSLSHHSYQASLRPRDVQVHPRTFIGLTLTPPSPSLPHVRILDILRWRNVIKVGVSKRSLVSFTVCLDTNGGTKWYGVGTKTKD